MKLNLLVLALAIGMAMTGRAALYSSSSGTLNATITDGSVFPYSNAINLSAIPDSLITDVDVTLTFTGGYNSDLYCYLVHNGVTVVLLNRIGITGTDAFGNTSAGFSVTLSDGSINNVHSLTSLSSGPYGADGRDISPLSSGATFDGTTQQNGGNPLGLFNDLDPNGTWTLYIADVSSGGGSSASILSSWSIEITAVPEPTTLALLGFGAVFAGAGTLRWWRHRGTAARS